VGEEITSGDMEAIAPLSGANFESASMEDAGGDVLMPNPEGLVLCMTEMGLNRLSQEVKGGQRVRELSTLLKAKVALESLIAQIGKDF